MVYEKQSWAAGLDGGTPLSPERLGFMEQGIEDAHRLAGGIFIDSFPGTDDQKLDAAIGAQKATAGLPPIVLSARNHTFNKTRKVYSGLKLIGTRASGPKNLELAASTFVSSRVTLGSSIGSGSSSWWVSPGEDCYDVYMADFAVGGNKGSSVHQFIDFPVGYGTMYACEFRSLSFNFMRSVFGRSDRVCAITQVVFSGHWTVINGWETQFVLGGSDNQLWMSGYINIGNSSAASQTGSYSKGSYHMHLSSLGKTNVGFVYISCSNGWRGLKVSGRLSNIHFFGGVYEGIKPSGSSTYGRAPGSLIRLEGGSGTWVGATIGQGMATPDGAEKGLVHMTAGEWNFISPCFYRGDTAEGVPCIYQTGGRLSVQGATHVQSESWTGRPVLASTISGSSASASSVYCPDLSMLRR